MPKWFEQEDARSNICVASRVRIVRNFEGFVFPGRMDEQTREKLLHLGRELSMAAQEAAGEELPAFRLDKEKPRTRMQLRQRRVINSALAQRETPMLLALAQDESVGLLFGGDDCLRLQVMQPGLRLQEAWERADAIEEAIGRRAAFAFDERYGYLTAFPTNVGTGLRASVILHLPVLSSGTLFRKLTESLSRFGVSLRPLLGEEQEECGSLYELYNQKTLGKTEQEILDLVRRMARKLSGQEQEARRKLFRDHPLESEDEIWRAYGVLRSARLLGSKDALHCLSAVREGKLEGILQLEGEQSILALMLQSMPGCLEDAKNLTDEKRIRAGWIRQRLPEAKEGTEGEREHGE